MFYARASGNPLFCISTSREIRKLHEPHTCSNPAISQDHAKLSFMFISKIIHTLINNDPSTLVLAWIAHVNVYRLKQKAIENIYGN